MSLQLTKSFYKLSEITWKSLNYHKVNIFKQFLSNYNKFLFLKKWNEKDSIIKDIQNLFKLKE